GGGGAAGRGSWLVGDTDTSVSSVTRQTYAGASPRTRPTGRHESPPNKDRSDAPMTPHRATAGGVSGQLRLSLDVSNRLPSPPRLDKGPPGAATPVASLTLGGRLATGEDSGGGGAGAALGGDPSPPPHPLSLTAGGGGANPHE